MVVALGEAGSTDRSYRADFRMMGEERNQGL